MQILPPYITVGYEIDYDIANFWTFIGVSGGIIDNPATANLQTSGFMKNGNA